MFSTRTYTLWLHEILFRVFQLTVGEEIRMVRESQGVSGVTGGLLSPLSPVASASWAFFSELPAFLRGPRLRLRRELLRL